MKKIIYSILTLSLILTGSLSVTSCGSDDSTTTVTPNPEPEDNNPQTQTLVVTPSATSGYLGDVITLSATLDGVAVTSGVTYYVDDVAISGNTITSDVEADLLVSAKYQNVTSDYVTVTFEENPFLVIEGEGSFIYNGNTYEINGGLLSLIGFVSDGNGGANSVWAQYGWSGNNPDIAQNFVAITFTTPATAVGNQVTDYEYPSQTNTAYRSIGFVTLGGIDVIETEYSEGQGTVIYNSFNDQSNPVTASFDMQITGVHNISFIYSGDVSTIASASSRMLEVKKFNVSPTIKSANEINLAVQKVILKK